MRQKTSLMLLAACTSVALWQANAQSRGTSELSKAEVKRLVREAHTPAEYRTLAAYFRSQQNKFEQEAETEKQEWERRSQNVSGPSAKYPRPVDSSKNRFEYFSYEAGQMAQQADHFEGLASNIAVDRPL